MIKALRFEQTGSLDSLSLQQIAAPRPQPGEVVVEICAAGVNPSDPKNVLGRFPYTTLPRTPGRDFAGVVVDGPAEMIGEEVWGTGKEFGFVRDGSHAERIAVPLDGIAPKPSVLTFAQAASCGVPYTTAWDAIDRCGLLPGDAPLVIGGSGGRAALDLGRWCGAQVIAGCAVMLDRFSIAFATGLLPPPPAPQKRSLRSAVEVYRELAGGATQKIVLTAHCSLLTAHCSLLADQLSARSRPRPVPRSSAAPALPRRSRGESGSRCSR